MSTVSPAAELIERARLARDQYDGHPPTAWSTGEQSAIALILRSAATLARLDITPEQAMTRLADDLATSPREAAEWVKQARANL